jgi:transposase-like protein
VTANQTTPKIDGVDGYNSQTVKTNPPGAAKFGVGARTIEQIKQATDARREHSRQLGEAGARFRSDNVSRERGLERRERQERLRNE